MSVPTRRGAVRILLVGAIVALAMPLGAPPASAGGGCFHDTEATVDRGDTVVIRDLCFTAAVLYTEPGTKVTWTNDDHDEHNVVGVGGTWGDFELTLYRGEKVTYRFEEEGVFPYACWLHPGMVGAVVVGDGVGTGLSDVVPADAGPDDAVAKASARDGSTIDVGWIATGVLVTLGCVAAGIGAVARKRAAEEV